MSAADSGLVPIKVISATMPDGSISEFIEAGKTMAFDSLMPPRPGRPVLFATIDGLHWIRLFDPRADGSWRGGPTDPAFHTFDSLVEPLRIIGAYRWGDHR